MKPGDVIKVRDWPNTLGQRFTIEAIVCKVGVTYPDQVYAKDSNGAFRAFPAANCRLARRTKRG